MTLALPELREMVEVARQYVAGEVHFSYLEAPAARCVFWSRVYGVHPAITRLALDWHLWVDQAWNEWGQHAVRLPEPELRRRIAADLGVSQPGVA